MQLSKNFTLEEMIVSPTAQRLGLSNTPTPAHVENMKYCCEKILEPVRSHFGKPITINSSYRSPAVNKAVGGSSTSQHVNGQAIDFEIQGIDNKKVADWIADNLEFDQVILEFYIQGDNNSGWVHASIKREGGNRKQKLIATKSKATGTVYTPVSDFDPSTFPGRSKPITPTLSGLGPIASLQAKCGLQPDGKWGPDTYRAARSYFKMSNNQAANFFGQCAHESGNFKSFLENLNYSAEGLLQTFPKYFADETIAAQYARKPEKIANRVYGGRMGNGPESSGDGYKFRGRGLIQLTGKANYQAFAIAINRLDVVSNPDIVAGELAFDSALWFFKKTGLMELSDKGFTTAIITQVTKKINGGTKGLDDRINKTQQFAAWS